MSKEILADAQVAKGVLSLGKSPSVEGVAAIRVAHAAVPVAGGIRGAPSRLSPALLQAAKRRQIYRCLMHPSACTPPRRCPCC